MKALNKKERQNAIFKFSLIYGLSFLFIGLMFWLVRAVPDKVEGGGSETVKSGDFIKLRGESEFLKDEIERAQEYVRSSMGSLGYAEEKLEFYYSSLKSSGEDALLDKDVRNNQKVANRLIDSMYIVINKGYKVGELELEKRVSAEASVEESLDLLSGLMNDFVSELGNRNDKNRGLTNYADRYFSCMKTLENLESGGDPTKLITGLKYEKDLLNEDLNSLKQEMKVVEDELKSCNESQNKSNSSDLEQCNAKRKALKKEIEKAENEISIVAGKLNGRGDRKEEDSLLELAKKLMEVRQDN